MVCSIYVCLYIKYVVCLIFEIVIGEICDGFKFYLLLILLNCCLNF